MSMAELSVSALMEITDRPDVVFVSGQGSWLTDHTGGRYLDFVQGWAVNYLGHALGGREARVSHPRPPDGRLSERAARGPLDRARPG
jgi:acetylornithine/succinyldiaminopimelate/putrescine aminotransferase